MIDFSRTTILFGGSFDPIHAGHLHVAKYALGSLPGAQLAFVPCRQSPGKNPPVAPAALRLQWLELATGPGAFQVWDFELAQPGPSYTVDTLLAAHRAGASRERLFWLLGADAYAGFPRWKEPGRIRALARLLVVNRPGNELALSSAEDSIVQIPPHPASSTALRSELAVKVAEAPHLPAPVLRALLTGKNPYGSGSS